MHAIDAIHLLPEAVRTPVGAEVYRGLTSRPKTLSPWLFYDAEGSRLFEAITELPEYYLTRAEREIFQRHAADIIAAIGSDDLTIYELGAGTASKTGLLLRAATGHQGQVTYHAIDVSASALSEAKQRLESDLPAVAVETHIADYTDGISSLPISPHRRLGERKLFLYIGSSIGNFEIAHALQVLRDIRSQLVAGDALLLGADLVKNRQTLLKAYNDSAGTTAAFNKNVLTRINRELGSNFNLHLFRHRARWNEEHSRIEMHLESLITQVIFIPALQIEVRLARGETIHTENSYKFTDHQLSQLLERAGFQLAQQWYDSQRLFGEYLAVAR